MYITSWDEFQKAAEELYEAAPDRTRYVSGFRHTDGELILKVTDDRTVVKFKTNQAADLKKFTKLNFQLMCKMQNHTVPEQPTVPDMRSGPQIPEVVSASASPMPQQKGKKNKKRKA